MGFFKRVAGLLGFGNHEVNRDDDDDDVNNNPNPVEQIHHLPRKGFSVPLQVPLPAHQIGPVLVPCAAGDGGLQGLGWYSRRLKIDEDGDVADEFLDEIQVHENQFPKFEVKLNTKSAKARNPRLSRQGTVQQVVEFGGRLQLV